MVNLRSLSIDINDIKLVIIFRFIAHEGPGYLGDFLDVQQIAWQLVKVDENEPLPASIN